MSLRQSDPVPEDQGEAETAGGCRWAERGAWVPGGWQRGLQLTSSPRGWGSGWGRAGPGPSSGDQVQGSLAHGLSIWDGLVTRSHPPNGSCGDPGRQGAARPSRESLGTGTSGHGWTYVLT